MGNISALETLSHKDSVESKESRIHQPAFRVGDLHSENHEVVQSIGPIDAIFVHGNHYRKVEVGGEVEYGASIFPFSGKQRITAAAEIYRHYPHAHIVTSGGKLYEDDLTVAEVYAKQLEKMGVAKEQIEKFDAPKTTLEELRSYIAYINHNPEWKRIGFVTSQRHIERVQVMYEHLATTLADIGYDRLNFGEKKRAISRFQEELRAFKERGVQIVFVNANAVLAGRDPLYTRLHEKEKATSEYQEDVKHEEEGIEDIIKNRYGRKK